MKRLHWLYKERELCAWCQHPRHLPKTKGLCSSCYRLARDFWKKPTAELGIAVSIAMNEGAIDPVSYPVDGLTIESLFEEIAAPAPTLLLSSHRRAGPRPEPFSPRQTYRVSWRHRSRGPWSLQARHAVAGSRTRHNGQTRSSSGTATSVMMISSGSPMRQ